MKREEVIELYKQDPRLVYDDKYTGKRRKINDNNYQWKFKWGRVIPKLFNIESFIDLGCSVGPFLEGALDGGVKEGIGLDVAGNSIKKYCVDELKDKIFQADLSEPLPDDFGKWDCSFSVEMAEHMLPEHTDICIDNIVKVAKKLIIFSSSPKSSSLHLNPHEPDYWKEKIESRGASFSKSKTDMLLWAWQMAFHEWLWEKRKFRATCKQIRMRLYSLMVFDVWK